MNNDLRNAFELWSKEVMLSSGGAFRECLESYEIEELLKKKEAFFPTSDILGTQTNLAHIASCKNCLRRWYQAKTKFISQGPREIFYQGEEIRKYCDKLLEEILSHHPEIIKESKLSREQWLNRFEIFKAHCLYRTTKVWSDILLMQIEDLLISTKNELYIKDENGRDVIKYCGGFEHCCMVGKKDKIQLDDRGSIEHFSNGHLRCSLPFYPIKKESTFRS